MMRRERERGRERNANGQLSGRPCGQVVYTRGLCVGCYVYKYSTYGRGVWLIKALVLAGVIGM